MLTLKAIIPGRRITASGPDVQRRVEIAMRNWSKRVDDRVTTYPGQTPPTDPKRKPYRRTGTLGRGWKQEYKPGNASVYNAVGYAGFVEGNAAASNGQTQTSVMRNKGWPRIDEVGLSEWQLTKAEVRAALTNR